MSSTIFYRVTLPWRNIIVRSAEYVLSPTIVQWITIQWRLNTAVLLLPFYGSYDSDIWIPSFLYYLSTWQWRLDTSFHKLYFNGSHDSDVWILSFLCYLSMSHMVVTSGYFLPLLTFNGSHDSDVCILSFLYYLSMGHMAVRSIYFLTATIFQWVTWQWRLDTFFPLLSFSGSHDSDVYILSFLYYLSMAHITVTSGYFVPSTIFQCVTSQWRLDTYFPLISFNVSHDSDILSFLYYLSMGHMTVTSGYFLPSTIFQCITWQWRLDTFFPLLYFNASHDSNVWILSSLYYLSMSHMTVTSGYFLSSTIF